MKHICIVLSFLLFMTGCAKKNAQIGAVNQDKPYLKISMAFNPEVYPWLLGKKYPQMAIWIVDSTGNTINPVFLTEKGSKNTWFGAKERPSALPVWYGAQKKVKKIEVDSVSGATPSGQTASILWQVPESFQGKKAIIYIEANVSFDYNVYFKKEAKEGTAEFAGVNGQPSIIWKADLDLGKKQKIVPVVIGHGQVLGKDHAIHKDLAKITTAKQLFDYLKIEYVKK